MIGIYRDIKDFFMRNSFFLFLFSIISINKTLKKSIFKLKSNEILLNHVISVLSFDKHWSGKLQKVTILVSFPVIFASTSD